jgi:hypothetical protein
MKVHGVRVPALWVAPCVGLLIYAGAVLLDFGTGPDSLFAGWNRVPEVMRDRVPGYAGIAVVFSAVVLLLTYAMNTSGRRAGWPAFAFILGITLVSSWTLTVQLATAASYDSTVSSSGTAWTLNLLGFVIAIVGAIAMQADSRKWRLQARSAPHGLVAQNEDRSRD